MRVTHHGDVLVASIDREIKPTEEESAQGIVNVRALVYNCKHSECRKRFYYRQDIYEIGRGPVRKVKENVGAFAARLKLASESDWVWGFDKITFQKRKVWVR